jgi:hypothetical protein
MSQLTYQEITATAEADIAYLYKEYNSNVAYGAYLLWIKLSMKLTLDTAIFNDDSERLLKLMPGVE